MTTYDVVVMGAGHNGLTAAAYMAKAGKRVLVLEAKDHYGGGVSTRELIRPGYWHDEHSNVHIMIQGNPMLREDELGLLSKFGLEYIYPDLPHASIWEDGTVVRSWKDLDRTCEEIAAFSPKDALHGRVVDVTRDGFLATMDVSCWTFLRMAHLAEPLMPKGGTLFTMSYYGSQRVVKNYNIMGVAKAALESAVRYMAAELGPKGIRVHAISPGPLATRAASGIPEFDALLDKAKAKAAARSLVSIDDVGVATAFLAHDAARLITGETLYVDGGYHIMD